MVYLDNVATELSCQLSFFSKDGKNTVYKKWSLPQFVITMNVSNYSQYDIALYRKKLQLSLNTQKRAEAILLDSEQAGITARKMPESLVAAALYIACILEDERRTQGQISQATGVSPHTIQIRYKQLVHDLKIQSASS